jgi:hypothetical protein
MIQFQMKQRLLSFILSCFDVTAASIVLVLYGKLFLFEGGIEGPSSLLLRIILVKMYLYLVCSGYKLLAVNRNSITGHLGVSKYT